ncbi:hypothetical protein [Methylobacterium nigriterrae]|uniref:hypothetical protein n=1 Tax=Methylobacterium nigriterrae TaxID=3127512 RepID=UPI003013DA11
MDALGWLGLTAAFLAPLPLERPWREGRTPPPRLNGWMLGLIAWFLLPVMLMPLSLAVSEHRALAVFGAACRESGGRVTHVRGEDGRPYRCDHEPGLPGRTGALSGLLPPAARAA